MSDEMMMAIDEDDAKKVRDEIRDKMFSTEAVKEQMLSYLATEYEDVRNGSERQEATEDWAEWRRISIAKPRSRTKDFPWAGAANVTTPFTFSNVNGVVSHLKAALLEKKPRMSVATPNEEYKEHAECGQAFVNELLSSPQHMNMAKKDEVIIFDLARLGTQVIEVPWETRRVQFKRMGRSGQPEIVDKLVYDGPSVVPHRLEDVIIRSHWNVQDAPYIGFLYHMTKQDLMREEYNGFFEEVDRIWSFTAQEDHGRIEEKERVGIDPSSFDSLQEVGTPYDVAKFYVRWDADEDGMDEDLIVWMEPNSKTLLRVEYNELGVRPVADARYITVPGVFYGLGVCAMLYSLQEEIDTMHNIGINSLHISSLQMFATPRGSGLGPDEPLLPLKHFEMDNPAEFVVIKFPNVSGETIQREQVAQQYGRTVTGISEVQLGMPDTTAKSGTGPQLQQFLSQQGNRVLRSIIANTAHAYSEVYLYVLLQLVANSDRVLAGDAPLLKLVPPEKREYVEEVLRMNVEDVAVTFQFSVRTTEADKTDDARRQFLMSKQQMYSMYMQQAMGIVQMLDNPQVQQMPNLMEFVNTMYVGLTSMMEEALELFDTERTGDYLPDVETQRVMLELIELMRRPQVEQMKDQLEEVKGGQGYRGGGEGTGIFTPGYTAGERSAGDAGGEGPAQLAGGQRGPSAQPPATGPAGPGASGAGFVPGA